MPACRVFREDQAENHVILPLPEMEMAFGFFEATRNESSLVEHLRAGQIQSCPLRLECLSASG